jgi:Flp pilus assembly protein TadB
LRKSACQNGSLQVFESFEKRIEVQAGNAQKEERLLMLWTIFVVLLVLWLLGVVSSYTVGGFIHILLVLALVVLLINIIQGRRPVV